MLKKMLQFLSPIFILITLNGCAGLMNKVTDLDSKTQNNHIKSGEKVSINLDALENSFKEIAPKENAKDLTTSLMSFINKYLNEKKINVDDSSNNKLKITVTKFDRGNSLLRFFGFFGMGRSYLDGKVVMENNQGTRVFTVEKTGYVSGMLAAGDQTLDNFDQFAEVVVNRITDKVEEKK
jgi:hypothetical protein